jgi:hypothetical protein
LVLALAKSLLQNGFSIHGSTTSVEKLTLLKKSNSAFLIVLESDKLLGDMRLFCRKHYSHYRHSSKLEEIITRILLEKYNY